jgi:hypothetical protein
LDLEVIVIASVGEIRQIIIKSHRHTKRGLTEVLPVVTELIE